MIPDGTAIREALTYEPHTGRLRWQHRPLHHFAHPSAAKTINGRSAGGVAGTPSSLGVIVVVNKRRYQAHHVAWFLHHGCWPTGMLQHLDGDKCNNRIINLAIRPGRKRYNGYQ